MALFYLPTIMYPVNILGSPDFSRALGLPYSRTIICVKVFQMVVDISPAMHDIFMGFLDKHFKF